MTPATRATLGLAPLPTWQACRVQAQHHALCNRPRPQWPAGCAHLPGVKS